MITFYATPRFVGLREDKPAGGADAAETLEGALKARTFEIPPLAAKMRGHDARVAT